MQTDRAAGLMTFRVVEHPAGSFRVPMDSDLVGVIRIDRGLYLAALRRRVRTARARAWADALSFRGYTPGDEPGLWVPTRASVTLPLALAGELATLVEEVKRVAITEGLIR